jgi:hypothetical protein
MRHISCGVLCVLSLALCAHVRGVEGTEQDQFEDRCIAKAAERVVKSAKSERGQWVKDLEAAYPGKVGNPTTEAEYGAWFDVLAGKYDEWRKSGAPNAQVTALFDKVVQRLELGPVPSITRE